MPERSWSLLPSWAAVFPMIVIALQVITFVPRGCLSQILLVAFLRDELSEALPRRRAEVVTGESNAPSESLSPLRTPA